ncbi:MAG: class I SAM-dependent methyltransferase [Pseudomonadota bacterium]
MSTTEDLQKSHYNSISDDYAAHYGDEWSQKYRNKFVNEYLVKNISIEDSLVLEAMCGSGETTAFLLDKNAKVVGLDISDHEVENFKSRWQGCDAYCASIRETNFADNKFDVVIVVGGLHHVHPFVNEVIEEICRILKPGGYFCFFEPHKGSFPDFVRSLWYKQDSLFADNEEGIDVDAIKEKFSEQFTFVETRYGGNVGYLFVFNSLVFRIPLKLKPILSPVLIFLESVFKPLQTKFTSCFVIGRWQKKN